MNKRIVVVVVLIGALILPLSAAAQSRRSMPRTLAGVGLMAGGVVVALTGTDCRTAGEFGTYSQATFLGSISLTGRSPVLSETCAVTDFTITGNVGFETLNRMASDYNLNQLQRDIKNHIEADVRGKKFRKAGNLYGGLALVGVGALLATVWANSPDVQLELVHGGARLSKTFGF